MNSEPSAPRHPCIIAADTDGIELNWIPPLEPNGDVYYVIEYNDGNTTDSVNTSSESTYFNLTGLQRGVTYNITVVAVNSAGRNDTGAVLNYTRNEQSKHMCNLNRQLSWCIKKPIVLDHFQTITNTKYNIV